ncbi:hypothetical protein ONE63_010728 [Megalurothrips usitatus]|uniref:THAP9-like helix-turn-helix domain-containing protein n=1 Tax=Megalurothrips usitatus TaxID=439358 RepID=A0AAV7XKG9_9NEOP|nr:hypothetical protein ONE63_010728 [Megalurothrips usitatus]
MIINVQVKVQLQCCSFKTYQLFLQTKDISSILEYLNVEEDDYLNKILLRKNINGLIIHVDELCKENANNPVKESELKSLSFVLNKVRKNMGLSADDALVMFQKHIPYEVYELLKRLVIEDKKQYKDLVRTFSLSIHFYSPLAYSFLRQRLGDGLPHTRTIQSWYTTIDKYLH